MAAPYHCKMRLKLLLENKHSAFHFSLRQFSLWNRKQLKKTGHRIINPENGVSYSTSKRKELDRLRESNKRAAKGTAGDLSMKDIHGVPDNLGRINHAQSFKQILLERYNQAKRSVVIRTQNPEATVQSLLTFGNLRHAHFTSQDKAYILAEFANEASVSKLKQSAGFFSEPNQFPMRSRILFDVSTRLRHTGRLIPPVLYGDWACKSSRQYPGMDTFQQEVESLCARRLLDDSDLRSRFFVCMQLEELMKSVLPEAYVLPFGSCLNGFGWWNSDLDMMLCYSKELNSMDVLRGPEQNGKFNSFRLLTETFSSSRHLAQITLSLVASLLQLTPRVHNVLKILNARVPIIRFKNMAVNLKCDISLHAVDSIKMTELLYLYSVCDPRVKPLMTVIKQWAISHHLTSGGEQQKPTTIGILFMLLYFLQTRSPPVVPTLRKLQSLASTTEMFYIDNTVYGLPSNPSLIPKSKNTETIEDLLHGFFTFYSEFDFNNKAISIIEGSTFTKPADDTPVYIENPISIGLNICRNIGGNQLQTFTSAMKDAALKMEVTAAGQGGTSSDVTSALSSKHPGSRLSALFSTNEKADSDASVLFSELFSDTELALANETNEENDAHNSATVQINTQSHEVS